MAKKWRTRIKNNGIEESYLFSNEIHAAYWYDQLALKYYGIDAKLNKIEKPNDFVNPIKKKTLPIGVRETKSGRYMSCIKNNKKRIHIGTFGTVDEALEAYYIKKQELQLLKDNETIMKDIEYNKSGDIIIKTSKKHEILVDKDKYYDLIKYTWRVAKVGYAQTEIKGKHIYMHRYLMNPINDEIVDHINGNKLDNRTNNLRISNRQLNAHNKKKQEGTSSKYVGVSLYNNKYIARIKKDHKHYNIGRYETEEEAVKAYNKKALELYGKFANINYQ
jgi:hypothetical protein